jgi:hypothetical protein
MSTGNRLALAGHPAFTRIGCFYPDWLERLRGLPPGMVELASGRFELTIGEPEQWVPGHRDHKAVRARARHILPL